MNNVFDKEDEEPIRDPIERLNEFRDMQDGWLEEVTGKYGKAPSNDGLDKLTEFFRNVYPSDLPNPLLAPTEQGGIEAEWFLDGNNIDATLEFDLETFQAIWHYLNRSTFESEYKELDAKNLEQLQEIFAQIRKWNK